MKNRFLISFITVIMFLSSFSSVSANSLPTYWEGTDSSGAVILEEDCPVELVKEELLFAIGEDDDSVTVKYTLHNPSDHQETVHLAFPIRTLNENNREKEEETTLLSDGIPLDHHLRYTPDEDPFTIDNALVSLTGREEDSFYRRDLPVTVYRCFWEEDTGSVKTVIDNDPSFCFLIGGLRSLTHTDDRTEIEKEISDGFLEFAVLGDTDYVPEWSQVPSSVKTETMRFEDFVQRTDIVPGIEEEDRFRIVSQTYKKMMNGNVIDLPDLYDMTWLPVREWAEYAITLEARSSLEHTIVTGLYPTVDEKKNARSYVYLLSPASLWASYGSLDISIETDLELSDASLTGFEKTEKGYQAHFDFLPEEELLFTLKDKREENHLLFRTGASLIVIFLAWMIWKGGKSKR